MARTLRAYRMPPEPEAPRRRDDRQPTPWRVEGAPEAKSKGPMGMPRPPGGRRFLYFVVALLALNFLFASLVPSSPNRIEVPYTQFLDQVDKDNVKSVFAKGDSLQGTFKAKVDPQESDHKAETKFTTFRPAFAPSNDELLSELRQKYDLLLLKVLSLLQDGDPDLAAAISSSREAIWGVLADPEKFSKL